ncbi:HNH endonuclease [Legionella pneumophila serogroup 1]
MANYRKHKPQLRVEFNFQCPYCHTREPEIGGAKSFHIDHYKPKKKFPDLICEYQNLIYSCRDCNNYKSDYWPVGIDRLMGREIIYLRPPEAINNHLDVSDLKWKAKTRKGSWNIEKLNLNSKINVQRRDDRNQIQKTILMLRQIQENYRCDPNYLERQSEFDKAIFDIEEQINSLNSKISGPQD